MIDTNNTQRIKELQSILYNLHFKSRRYAWNDEQKNLTLTEQRIKQYENELKNLQHV
jgi:hypothetical protein